MSDTRTIRFLLNGELQVLEAPAPTTTVLNFLREQAGLRGTKEGCAEGDCGACTTVVAENENGRLRLRPINACIQFLPTLDGKALFTVEGLSDVDGALHPVQQAMVSSHGSQCGFCTPGFVMSLFALYKTQHAPSRAEINLALSGNLCRCTGYRPILDAANLMYQIDGQRPKTGSADVDWRVIPASADKSATAADAPLVEKLSSLTRSSGIAFETPALQPLVHCSNQRYFAPQSADELANLLAAHPDATLLAGGTDIGLWVTKQHRPLATLIYLGQIAELAQISHTEKHIEIGAAVKLRDAFAELERDYPELNEIARRFASPPICSAGTLVGNIANGSPIGDSMPALICLQADLILRKADQTRTVSLDEFYLGYQRKDLEAGEFVSAVRVPRRPSGLLLRSYKWSKRYDQDISAVCAAFSGFVEAGVIRNPRVCFGGLAAIPKRAHHVESCLSDQPFTAENVFRAARLIDQDFQPITDMRASDHMRSRVAKNLVRKFFDDVNNAQAEHRVFALQPVVP